MVKTSDFIEFKHNICFPVYSVIVGQVHSLIFSINTEKQLLEIIAHGVVSECYHFSSISGITKGFTNPLEIIISFNNTQAPREFFASCPSDRDILVKLLSITDWSANGPIVNLGRSIGIVPVNATHAYKLGKFQWTKRFMVLFPNRLIIADNRVALPRWVLSLYTFSITPGEKDFSIVLKSNILHKEFQIAFDNQEHLETWVKELSAFCKGDSVDKAVSGPLGLINKAKQTYVSLFENPIVNEQDMDGAPFDNVNAVSKEKVAALEGTPTVLDEYPNENKQGQMIEVVVNGEKHFVPEGVNIKEACRIAGYNVPTLCAHPRLPPAGKCKVCVVDVVGQGTVFSCSAKVKEGMEIVSNSASIRAKQAAAMNQIFANKVNIPSPNKEMAELSDIYKETLKDDSSHAIVRDMSECVGCTRCVRACNELQGMNVLKPTNDDCCPIVTDTGVDIADTGCISCGQCSVFCPTGAIKERDDIDEVLKAMDAGKIVTVQTAPATRVAIAECFDLPPGTVAEGKMVAACKRSGFQYVFDTNFTADLTILEEGSELLQRVEKGGPFPMFTSCCPGWINLVEKHYPQFCENLSTCRSPQMMMGPLIKTYWAEKKNIHPNNIFQVSIMPCTAKKDEIQRPQMFRDGRKDVDIVLTTRELGRLFKIKGIKDIHDFAALPDEKYDSVLGKSSGAAVLFGVSGGVMEAALRTVFEIKMGQPLPKLELRPCRGIAGIKEALVPLGDLTVKIAIVNSMKNVRKFLEEIDRGERFYHFIEIMCCPCGCIGGGGQPASNDPDVMIKRMNAVYTMDEQAVFRKSHENSEVQELYNDFLHEPLGHLSHKLLHTHYTDRSATVVKKGGAAKAEDAGSGDALILYGSQSGKAKNAALDMAAGLKGIARVMNMADYDVNSLPNEKKVFFVISTFGEGEFPDSAKSFWEGLQSQGEGSLTGLQYAVCGLGSADYKATFNFAARFLDEQLLKCGAEKIMDRAECDDKHGGGYGEVFDPWAKEVKKLCGGAEEIPVNPRPAKYTVSIAVARGKTPVSKRPSPPGFTLCPLVSSTVLSAPDYDREVRQFDIDISGSGLSYITGDHVSILPRNDPQQVKEFLDFYGLDPEVVVNINSVGGGSIPFPSTLSVEELFEQYVDLNAPLNAKFLNELALFATDEKELMRINELLRLASDDKDGFGKACKEETVESIMRMCPITMENVPLEQFLTFVPVIQPRLYSIASSSIANPVTVQVAIVIFNWQTPVVKRWRTGLCTGYLFGLDPANLPLVAVTTKKGLLEFPTDPTVPMCMFGLGSGIGVFRGFVQERSALVEQGVTLGIGHVWHACRHKHKDFVYRDEFVDAMRKGALEQHYGAHSHDQKEFITIPYVMEHEPEKIWKMVQDPNCHLYYCGPAFGIPQKIMDTIQEVCMNLGGMTPKQAAEHMAKLKNNWFVECFSA